MRDEKSLRRPDFLPGCAVRMADGQVWSLPKAPDPYAGTADAGTSPFADGGVLDREYQATIAAVLDAEDEAERLRAELALAILLLTRNYKLRPADYQELLCDRPGSPVIASLQEAFHAVALEHARHFRRRADAESVHGQWRRILPRLTHLWAWGR